MMLRLTWGRRMYEKERKPVISVLVAATLTTLVIVGSLLTTVGA